MRVTICEADLMQTVGFWSVPIGPLRAYVSILVHSTDSVHGKRIAVQHSVESDRHHEDSHRLHKSRLSNLELVYSTYTEFTLLLGGHIQKLIWLNKLLIGTWQIKWQNMWEAECLEGQILVCRSVRPICESNLWCRYLNCLVTIK